MGWYWRSQRLVRVVDCCMERRIGRCFHANFQGPMRIGTAIDDSLIVMDTSLLQLFQCFTYASTSGLFVPLLTVSRISILRLDCTTRHLSAWISSCRKHNRKEALEPLSRPTELHSQCRRNALPSSSPSLSATHPYTTSRPTLP